MKHEAQDYADSAALAGEEGGEATFSIKDEAEDTKHLTQEEEEELADLHFVQVIVC